MRAIVLAAIVALAACAGSRDDDAVTVSERAEVMDRELRDMTTVLPDRIVITTARDDVHRKLFGLIGHTFVSGRSGDSDGFVREVLSVERDGNVSTLLTQTSSLEKVIEKGHLHVTQDYASADIADQLAPATLTGKLNPRGEISIPETVLYDSAKLGKLGAGGVTVGGEVKLQSATFQFNPKLDLDADYDDGLQSFHFAARGDVRAKIVTSAKLVVSNEAELLASRSDPLETTVRLFQSPKVRATFLAGIVPVEFATSVYVEVVCGLTFEGSVDVTAGGTLTGTMSTGVDWKKGRPLSVLGQTPSFRFEPFASAKVGRAVELECNVQLGLEVLFYEVVGATLTVGPYSKLRLEPDASETAATLSIWTGAKAEIAGKLDILGRSLTLEPENPLFVWPASQANRPAKTYRIGAK